jgi:ribosomal protein S18 acetylase RimI-like enzyme
VNAPVSLRLLQSHDLDRYRRLRLEAIRAEPTAFGSSFESEIAARADKYRDRLTGASDNYVLGAFVTEELVGMIGFVRETAPKRAHVGSVWGLYVAPRWRGRGIGRTLLGDVLRRARALPELEHVLITVVSNNPGARRLYESVGFTVWGIEPAALKVDDVGYDEIHMLLALEAARVGG